MSVTIANATFDRHHYDRRGDVLYLNVGAARPAARSVEIDGGHAVHYDDHDSIVGLTLLNVRHTLEKNWHLDLTIPVVRLVDPAGLREVLAAGRTTPD